MIDSVKMCSCGNMMEPLEIGSDINFCANCDRCQPIEADGGKRIPTVQDRRFNLAWAQRVRTIYPNAA